MPGKLTLYPPQHAPRFFVLRDNESVEIGRDPACDLVLDDPRVSKRHARLRWTGTGWALDDLNSKNGTKVNGEPPRATDLADRDRISLGGLPALFERLTATQAAALDSERLARIQTSAEVRRQLGADLEPTDLLLRFLELAMKVAIAERGFVLVASPDGRLRPEAAAGFSAGDLWEDRFRGSAGAVKEALETGGPVFVSDAQADPRLGKRPSVVALGIWSLVCVPLRHAGKVLGVVYMDSRKLGPGFSSLDLEIIEDIADYVATVLARLLRRRSGSTPPPDGGLISQLRLRLEELLPSV
jgi:hypothetical protein